MSLRRSAIFGFFCALHFAPSALAFDLKGLVWGNSSVADARRYFEPYGIDLTCVANADQTEVCYRSDALALQFTIAGIRTKSIELKFCSDRLFWGEFRPEGSDRSIKQMADAFTEKYGRPEDSGNETKQNRFGAQFIRRYWFWAFGAETLGDGGILYDSVVALENMSESNLTPSLTIISPKTMAHCEGADVSWKNKTNSTDDL